VRKWHCQTATTRPAAAQPPAEGNRLRQPELTSIGLVHLPKLTTSRCSIDSVELHNQWQNKGVREEGWLQDGKGEKLKHMRGYY